MGKQQFLSMLRERLRKLPNYEIDAILSFYEETIEDKMEEGMSEQDAVASFGGIETVMKDLLVTTPLAGVISEKVHEHWEPRKKSKTKWIVAIACTSPIWLPIVIALIAAFIAIYVSVWAVAVSVVASVFSLIVAGVGVLIMAGWLAVRDGFSPTVLISISGGFVLTGLFVLTVRPALALCKQIVALTASLMRAIKKRIRGKKEGTA